MKKLLFITTLLLTGLQAANAHTLTCPIVYIDSAGALLSEGTVVLDEAAFDGASGRPNPVVELFKKRHRLNKRITAAVLAFPFPFGIVGLHRIYMGTKPYVPVVYIATVGGVFGILPFIDFCVLVFDKDFNRYENNGRVFMWIKSDEKK